MVTVRVLQTYNTRFERKPWAFGISIKDKKCLNCSFYLFIFAESYSRIESKKISVDQKLNQS